MALIQLITEINAPIERCFNLSLSVDLHKDSTAGTGERIIAGVSSGMMKSSDTVTWRAKHFGITQNLTTKISACTYPNYFVDEMVKGAFKKIYHQHVFHPKGSGTVMTDLFEFEAPFGIIGRVFSKLVLTNYMKDFLTERNRVIKKIAESDDWKKYLSA